jgi:two-component system, chemotaxis family, sensor kinase Cph1
MDGASALTAPDDALLAECAREPIQTPGAIQPHGVLLGLDPHTGHVRVRSANAAAFLGRDADTLDALLGPEAAAHVQALPEAGEAFDGRHVGYLRLPDGRTCEAVSHEADGLLVLELTPEAPPGDAGLETLRVQAAVGRIMQAPEAALLLQQAADEVRALTGFDRVDVYRFDDEWNGEVVAEARADEMTAYLGLHFPASDIPSQARALYARNRLRLIPDAAYTPVPLVPDGGASGAPLDLSLSVLRSVSPVHLEYLANMGVRASMSVSILHEGALWGLIACHHRTPHRVSFRTQASCALVGQVLGILLDRHRATDGERARAERQYGLGVLLDGLLRAESVTEALAGHGDTLMALVGATGVAICGDGLHLHGQTPPPAEVERLCVWVQAQPDDVFATHALGRAYPPAADYADVAAGLLAVTFARRRGHTVLWFRPEQPREVTWAGAPEKNVRTGGDGVPRLHPRHSFAAWQTLLRGHARPWTEPEREAAATLRRLVLDLVYERVEAIQRLNRRLSRANDTLETRNRELQDFAFVASHDLREPLRKIRAFSDLLRKEHDDDLPAGARGYIERTEAASIRAMQLVDDLLLLSRVNTRGRAFARVELGDVVETVRSDLQLLLDETGTHLETRGPWPSLQSDGAQLAQALRLLVENAVKFRARDRAARVEIEALTREGEEGEPGQVVLCVRDNGIGFEDRFAERIFKPFERLHSRTAYPGTGMGLAIVRRIAERHGGRVTARSVLGEGSVFELELPEAHDPAPGAARPPGA